MAITNLQAQALCRILKMAESFDYSRGNGRYEIKQYDVKEFPTFLSVVIEVGMTGDEGTLASVICRDRAHVFVGKRGGITYYPTTSKSKDMKARRMKGSLMSVVIDQRIV